MKEIVYWLAKHTGLFALCRRITKGEIRILAYHGIWLGQGHFGNHLFMSPECFARRLDLLARWGFPVLSLSEAMSSRASGTLPDAAVVLTIDDGWYGSFVHMLPALEKHGFPATLYVTTYYCEKQEPVFDVLLQYLLAKTQLKHVSLDELRVQGLTELHLDDSESRAQAQAQICSYANGLEADQRSYFGKKIAGLFGVAYDQILNDRLFHLMNLNELSEMSGRGISLELHTHRHRIERDGRSCLLEELRDNRSVLEPIVGKALTHFCYPSGVYREDVWPELTELGITSATTTEPGLVNEKTHCFALPRILDGELVSDLEFEAELTGFGDMIRRVKSVFGSNSN